MEKKLRIEWCVDALKQQIEQHTGFPVDKVEMVISTQIQLPYIKYNIIQPNLNTYFSILCTVFLPHIYRIRGSWYTIALGVLNKTVMMCGNVDTMILYTAPCQMNWYVL